MSDPSYQLKTTEEGVSWVRIPNYPLMNTDANGRIFLNWNTKFYKQTGLEFIEKPIEAPFVIFGTTAEGITNPVPNPAGPNIHMKYKQTFYIILLLGLLLANQLGHQESRYWQPSSDYYFSLLHTRICSLCPSTRTYCRR